MFYFPLQYPLLLWWLVWRLPDCLSNYQPPTNSRRDWKTIRALPIIVHHHCVVIVRSCYAVIFSTNIIMATITNKRPYSVMERVSYPNELHIIHIRQMIMAVLLWHFVLNPREDKDSEVSVRQLTPSFRKTRRRNDSAKDERKLMHKRTKYARLQHRKTSTDGIIISCLTLRCGHNYIMGCSPT